MFVPLRLHSVFSKGKGGLTVGEAACWAGSKGLPAAALTDIANFYGWGKWKKAAVEAGVRPIFGCELEIGGLRLVFLVKDGRGYGNLMEIFNGREIRGAEGLVTILIPGKQAAEGGARLPESLEASRKTGDLYIGGDFSNFGRASAMALSSGLPLVWANPLKFIGSPERLILLRAIERKIPFPPERRKWAGRMGIFGPDQEPLAVKRFGGPAKDALLRTREVAEKCVFVFEDVVPPLPEGIFPKPLRDVVRSLLASGKDLSWKERRRARHELEVVEASGFGPYFLVVHDVVDFARRRGILHNLRGSGASSYLAHLLGISPVNPIEFDLYFERFLNRGRSDPPDIDLDFDSRRRDEVLAYVMEKYGRGRTTGAAFVCSLKNFGARSALYETARAFGLPPGEARSLTRRLPFFADPDFLKRDAPAPGHLEIWKSAAGLDGVFAEISLHVGGVILTPAPVERRLPLEESAKGVRMCHFDRDAVEDLRLIKLDLLSVRGLAAVSEARTRLALRTVPEDDPAVYRMIGEARTIGCFQIESPAMMNLLRRMKPRNVFDLTQALALVRPGPTESGMKEAVLRSREGRPSPHDALLDRILPETGGVLLYEEQVMQIAERVAGMPPEEGERLRRGLKKKGEDSAALKERFFREAGERGFSQEAVASLWTTMEKFSSYSFNKAHSASYALLAYQAAYLKTHHKAAYLAAVLNAGGGYYGIGEYIEEAKRQGIRILGPDIQRSSAEFEVESGAIRVGLKSIKGLAGKTIEAILSERKESGPFLSIEDFMIRLRPGKSELLTLIRSGVFDTLEPRRTRQILLHFQGIEDLENVADIAPEEKARSLVDMLGFSPELDTLDLCGGKRPPLRIGDLPSRLGDEVELLVRVVDVRHIPLKGGGRYFYLFEDESGLLEGTGEVKCLSFGSPPACCLRGEVRASAGGSVKMFNCTFLRAF